MLIFKNILHFRNPITLNIPLYSADRHWLFQNFKLLFWYPCGPATGATKSRICWLIRISSNLFLFSVVNKKWQISMNWFRWAVYIRFEEVVWLQHKGKQIVFCKVMCRAHLSVIQRCLLKPTTSHKMHQELLERCLKLRYARNGLTPPFNVWTFPNLSSDDCGTTTVR